MLVSFVIWLQNTDFFASLRYSSYAYLIILTIHILCITLFGGLILITDLKLLGWAFRKEPYHNFMARLRTLKRLGLTLVVACGFLLFGSKAEEYYHNPFFRIKFCLLMLIVLHALIFRRRVYSDSAALDSVSGVPPKAKIAAALSMLLWAGVVCAGRGIGYISPGKSPHHYTSSIEHTFHGDHAIRAGDLVPLLSIHFKEKTSDAPLTE